MIFKLLPPNSTPADADSIVGVTAGGQDNRVTFANLLAWLKAKTAWLTASNIDFSSFPRFMATGTFSHPSGGVTVQLTGLTASKDPSGGFASSRYTIPVAGTYLFTAVWGGGSAGASNISITKNAPTTPLETGTDLNLGNINANYFTPVIATFIDCAVGDVIGICAYSAAATTNSPVTFKGIMISK